MLRAAARRHRAVLPILEHMLGIALDRIAETAGRGPHHGIDIGGMLLEILLAQLQRDFLALGLAMSSTISRRSRRSRMSLLRMKRVDVGACRDIPPSCPVEVGMALPDDSVSCTIASVLCGMKQLSAERPPR